MCLVRITRSKNRSDSALSDRQVLGFLTMAVGTVFIPNSLMNRKARADQALESIGAKTFLSLFHKYWSNL